LGGASHTKAAYLGVLFQDAILEKRVSLLLESRKLISNLYLTGVLRVLEVEERDPLRVEE